MGIAEYWQKFLKESNLSEEDVGFAGEIDFEGNSITGPARLALVLGGKKTAMFSSFDAYGINRDNLPVSGELHIVENSEGEPCAIIEIVAVNVIPFCDISWELASRDGEDENLESWRDKMRELMEDEAAICGFEFKDSSKIVCEIFRVIYR